MPVSEYKGDIHDILIEVIMYIIANNEITRLVDYQGNYFYRLPHLDIRDVKNHLPIITFYNRSFTVNKEISTSIIKLVESEYNKQLEYIKSLWAMERKEARSR